MTPVRVARPAPPASLCGDAALLARPLLGLLCASTVPPDLVLPTFDFVAARVRRGTAFIGGFHGPIERQCLDLIFRLDGAAVVSLARSMVGWVCPTRWAGAAAAGQLLVISEFGDARLRRPTLPLALQRNEAVVRRSRSLFVPAARAGGRSYRTAKAAIEAGIPVRCFDHPANRDLLILGGRPMSARIPADEPLEEFDE